MHCQNSALPHTVMHAKISEFGFLFLNAYDDVFYLSGRGIGLILSFDQVLISVSNRGLFYRVVVPARHALVLC